MKTVLMFLALLLISTSSITDEIILIYSSGNDLFKPSAGRHIVSVVDIDNDGVSNLLLEYGMTAGCRLGSDLVTMLDGYYAFLKLQTVMQRLFHLD